MKRFLSITLALIMILSFSVIGNTVTFAEEQPAYDAEVLNAEGTKIADLNLSELTDFGAAGTKMAGWDGYTIKLLKDITTANTVFLVGNITFDGNGHQITFTGNSGNKNVFSVATDADKLGEGAGPSEYKTVKIVNLKATTTGTILIHYFANVEFGAGNVFEASGAMFIGNRTNAGKLTFTGGEYTSKGGSAIFSLEFRAYEVEILGGSFSTTSSSIIQMRSAGGTVNIGGGKFVLSGGDGVIVNMLDGAPGNLNVNIYDGYFYCTTYQRIVVVLAGTANVYGGIFYNTSRGDLFTVRNNAKLNIYGGTIINAAGQDPVQNVNNALVYPAEAKLNPTMLDGASVRLVADSNGIRFESSISKTLTDWVNEQKDAGTQISYGTLIMPTDTLPANYAFTVNALKSLGKQEGVDYVNIPAADGISKDAKGNLLIRAALVNLQEGNYNRELSAVSYVRYTKDGHEVYIYSNYNATNNSRSMAYVAQAALDDVVDTANSVYRYEVTVAGATKYSRYTEAQRTALGRYIANN